MGHYKGSDLTITELLSALHAKVIDLSERKEHLQQYVSLQKHRSFILNEAKKCVDLRYVFHLYHIVRFFGDLQYCHSQLEQYIEKIGDISRLFKRCFNAASDINQLPVELLTRVFVGIQVHRSSKFPRPFAIKKRQDDFSGVKEAISWVPLATHVCNYWREVALSTPSLWNDIYFNVKQAGFDKPRYYPPLSLLLRSCSAPLHIAAHVRINYTDHGSEPTKLYEALRTISQRTETFQLHWDGTLQAGIMDALRHPFPQLTSLTLCSEMGGSALPEEIFGRELPQLRRLSLWFYNCWPHHKFPNLTHIALNDQHIRPSINGFLDLLESTPRLEFLYLCEAGPKIDRTAILPQRAVSLPSLQIAQFATKVSAEPDSLSILECLTMRQLTRCLVRSGYRPPISPDVFETIFTHINPEGIIELCVYQYQRYFHVLEVDASRISIQTTPRTLVTLPAPTLTSSWNIKHLHLVSDVEIPRVDWKSFPNLLSITRYDSLKGIKALVTSLSLDGCPLLETIYLRRGEQLRRVDKHGDGELVQGVLNRFPECTVIQRNPRNSYQVALDPGPLLPEAFQTEASITLPKLDYS